jgi:hypothetical protein
MDGQARGVPGSDDQWTSVIGDEPLGGRDECFRGRPRHGLMRVVVNDVVVLTESVGDIGPYPVVVMQIREKENGRQFRSPDSLLLKIALTEERG